MVRSLEEIQKEKEAADRGPLRIFLYLAAVMVLVSILAYTFEEWLFDLSRSDSTFVVAISAPLVAALFFLYCYRTPRLGLKLLGHGAELPDIKDDGTSVTYDIFQGETGTDEVIRNRRRREARRLRKRTARHTDDPAAGPTGKNKPDDRGDKSPPGDGAGGPPE